MFLTPKKYLLRKLYCCAFVQLSTHAVKGGMDEKVYRQSRLCRLMGNPIAFAVVDALSQNKELTPSEIAHAVGRSVS